MIFRFARTTYQRFQLQCYDARPLRPLLVFRASTKIGSSVASIPVVLVVLLVNTGAGGTTKKLVLCKVEEVMDYRTFC